MGPSIVRAALALSLATSPAEGAAAPTAPPSDVPVSAPAPAPPAAPPEPSTVRPVPEAPPEAVQYSEWVRPPTATWVLLGVSAGLFATGLGFTLTATSIEHEAGNVNANGVDIGLTRARAVQGQNDAVIGNTLLISAGVALVAAVTLALLHAKNSTEVAAPPAADHPLALQWSLP